VKAGSFIISVCLIAGCGGVGSTKNTPGIDFVPPMSSTGFAKLGNNISTAPSGTEFTIPVQTFVHDPSDPHNYQTGSGSLRVKIISNDQIEVSQDGASYILDRRGPNYFHTETGFPSVVAIITNLNSYASIGEFEFLSDTGAGNFLRLDQSRGVFGFATDPAVLTGAATYAGTVELFVGQRDASFDFATGSVAMNANFGSGALSGSVMFNDAVGDGGGLGNVDIGSFNIDLSGEIDGNAFAAPIQLDPTDIDAIAAPRATLSGAFFGPNGEFASGTVDGVGTSAAPGAGNDMHWSMDFDTKLQ